MKLNAFILTTASVITILGCGKSDSEDSNSSDGFAGIYGVTSQTKNSENCDQEGAADTSAPAFYRILANSEIFPGAPGWSSETCATIETCKDDTLDLGDLVFETKSGESWIGESTMTATGGVNCSVTINAAMATKQANGTFVFEVKSHRGTLDLTGDDCDPDSPKIEENRSKLVCSEYKKIVTTAAQ